MARVGRNPSSSFSSSDFAGRRPRYFVTCRRWSVRLCSRALP